MATLLLSKMLVTLDETASCSTFTSSNPVSLPRRPKFVPVGSSPCCFSFSVVSIVFPLRSTVHSLVPLWSAAAADCRSRSRITGCPMIHSGIPDHCRDLPVFLSTSSPPGPSIPYDHSRSDRA